MRRIVLILLMLLVAAPAFAVAKKCPPKCKHRTQECAASKKSDQPRGPDGRFIARAPAAAPALWDALVDGFELSAGFRWQTERECPTLALPNPSLEARDPFYVGAQVNLPLTPRAKLFGAFDRDFTDAPNWQVRTGVSFRPLGGSRR